MSARGSKPTRRGTPPPAKPKHEYADDDPTSIYDSDERHRVPVEEKPAEKPGQPMVAISMKTPADPKLAPVPSNKQEREMPHVKLRAMSEVARAQQPQNLGNLAPPYDPAEARARTMRDYVLWGSLAVVIASGIALAVWLVAT
jgi:hypothetical protein